MRSFKVANWRADYAELVQTVIRSGVKRPSRAGPTLDLGPVTLMTQEWVPFLSLAGREKSTEFARLEQLLYLAGQEPLILGQRYPRYRELCEEEGGYHGAYGPRLHVGVRKVLRLLRDLPDSRRAVIPIWQPDDLTIAATAKDVPCSLSLGFGVDDGHLDCYVYMRSCDVWLGLYYDLPAFSGYHHMVAYALDVLPGNLWLTASSLHLYERDLGRAHYVDALEDHPFILVGPELLFGKDPVARWEEIEVWAAELLERERSRED